jgi:hypothetical protein
MRRAFGLTLGSALVAIVTALLYSAWILSVDASLITPLGVRGGAAALATSLVCFFGAVPFVLAIRVRGALAGRFRAVPRSSTFAAVTVSVWNVLALVGLALVARDGIAAIVTTALPRAFDDVRRDATLTSLDSPGAVTITNVRASVAAGPASHPTRILIQGDEPVREAEPFVSIRFDATRHADVGTDDEIAVRIACRSNAKHYVVVDRSSAASRLVVGVPIALGAAAWERDRLVSAPTGCDLLFLLRDVRAKERHALPRDTPLANFCLEARDTVQSGRCGSPAPPSPSSAVPFVVDAFRAEIMDAPQSSKKSVRVDFDVTAARRGERGELVVLRTSCRVADDDARAGFAIAGTVALLELAPGESGRFAATVFKTGAALGPGSGSPFGPRGLDAAPSSCTFDVLLAAPNWSTADPKTETPLAQFCFTPPSSVRPGSCTRL